jgi:hypothetical protein
MTSTSPSSSISISPRSLIVTKIPSATEVAYA